VKKQVQAYLIATDEMKTARHKTEKMNSKESVLKLTTIKKSCRCGNCGLAGRTKLQYAEPDNIIEN